MSKKEEGNQPEVAPKTEQPQVEAAPNQLDPKAFSYRQDGVVELPAETFEILRGYMAEVAQKNPPKKFFQNTYPTVVKKKVGKKMEHVIEHREFESDEAYKSQRPLELRDTDSFNAVFVVNLLHQAHIHNIEKGNAVAIETLRKEQMEAAKAKEESRMKKVED